MLCEGLVLSRQETVSAVSFYVFFAVLIRCVSLRPLRPLTALHRCSSCPTCLSYSLQVFPTILPSLCPSVLRTATLPPPSTPPPLPCLLGSRWCGLSENIEVRLSQCAAVSRPWHTSQLLPPSWNPLQTAAEWGWWAGWWAESDWVMTAKSAGSKKTHQKR